MPMLSLVKKSKVGISSDTTIAVVVRYRQECAGPEQDLDQLLAVAGRRGLEGGERPRRPLAPEGPDCVPCFHESAFYQSGVRSR